ncbi:hypothetical protein RJ641_034774 [Dillenia turbinata]|uniref:Uncharacterized protein n=1 Tax=Dillenia turbinata TaxID=194707 RepID=A0AAN8ZBU1_9MAGN
MEKKGQLSPSGSRQLNLKKSFKLGVRSLLTACPKEEFSKAFPKFTMLEQEVLHQLFVQVITSLHGNIEDEFESLCRETQVGTTVDSVEEHVQEQTLDPLYIDKIFCRLLGKAEKQRSSMLYRVATLRKEMQELSATADALYKLRSGILKISNKQVLLWWNLLLV